MLAPVGPAEIETVAATAGNRPPSERAAPTLNRVSTALTGWSGSTVGNSRCTCVRAAVSPEVEVVLP